MEQVYPWSTTSNDDSPISVKKILMYCWTLDKNIEEVYISFAKNVLGNDSIEYNLCELMVQGTIM